MESSCGVKPESSADELEQHGIKHSHTQASSVKPAAARSLALVARRESYVNGRPSLPVEGGELLCRGSLNLLPGRGWRGEPFPPKITSMLVRNLSVLVAGTNSRMYPEE